MKTSFEWKPELTLLEQVLNLASQRGQSPETIVDQAVIAYLQTQFTQPQSISRGQSLINHMKGKATTDLTTDEIMHLTRGDDD